MKYPKPNSNDNYLSNFLTDGVLMDGRKASTATPTVQLTPAIKMYFWVLKNLTGGEKSVEKN
jgi:hypothetical protein